MPKNYSGQYSGEQAKRHTAHKGHRERKKELFLKIGIDHLPDHEVLELLLFYCIPKSDVNELAHKLINKFGSLYEALSADYLDLVAEDGVGVHTATFFFLFRQLARRYINGGVVFNGNTPSLNMRGDLICYCENLFAGVKVEKIAAIFLKQSGGIIGHEIISVGGLDAVDFKLYTAVRKIQRSGVKFVALTHNHPGASPKPSRSDIIATAEFGKALKIAGIRLLDHIIVGCGGTFSMTENGYFGGNIW